MSETQSKTDSWMETITNTAIGFLVAMVGNAIILPLLFGIDLSAGGNALCALAYTGLSIVRQYTLRRMFNGRSVWLALKDRFVCQHLEFTNEPHWWDRRCVHCGASPEYNGAR